MSRFSDKHFLILAAAPMMVAFLLQWLSIRQESATFDEPVHLAAGYRYWKLGKFAMNSEHPPLQKLLSALPLLPLAPPVPAADPALDQSAYARQFLYGGPHDADRLLFRGRLVTMLLTTLLLCALAWAAKLYFGSVPALLALWLCALDPNLIAHGRYVTTDLASALFFFLTVVLWIEYLRSPSFSRGARSALVLGLALSVKFSMVILLPLLPVLIGLHWILTRACWVRSLRAGAAALLIVLGAALVVMVTYAPESWRTFRGRKTDAEPQKMFGATLPAHHYLTGLHNVIAHNQEGHPAYLLGKVSESGFANYFPVVFAVKSPSALLVALLLAAALALFGAAGLFRGRPGAFVWLGLLVPPVLYFAVSLTSSINLGVRHLLPIYPFLYLLCAVPILAVPPRRTAALLACALLACQAAETAAVYPDYLGFFNTFAGGPKAGSAYLLDSNLDWGQDLKKLRKYLNDNQPGPLCLEYFGSVDPAYYGIKTEYLPKTWDKDERERMNCIGAISATLLQDVYIRPGSYAWLRQRSPIGVVGSSIYLYDLRKSGAP